VCSLGTVCTARERPPLLGETRPLRVEIITALPDRRLVQAMLG
jgi:hypothetical protein